MLSDATDELMTFNTFTIIQRCAGRNYIESDCTHTQRRRPYLLIFLRNISRPILNENPGGITAHKESDK